MSSLTDFRSLTDRVMQVAIVYEDTIRILMSACEEASRNREIPAMLLGILQQALLAVQEHYLSRIWPTLKDVCGYTEKRWEVIPQVLESRDPDHRDIARGLA